MTEHRATILLNPGPVTLSARVRRAMAKDDICHREPEFAQLQHSVRRRIRRVYEPGSAEYEAVLITGSGTAAVEMMLGSLVPPQGRVLVVSNGVYGERAASILKGQQTDFELLTGDWERPLDLSEAEERLSQGPPFSHVFTVHHETTTGRLNDLAGLGRLCRDRGIPLLLDSVSSFGAEHIGFCDWNLQACAATANKCIHGVPGISFVLATKSSLESLEPAVRGLYLDLATHYAQQKQGFSPFTPAVHVLYALEEALKELAEDGGWQRRRTHYRTLSQRVLKGLESMGATPLLNDVEAYSSMLVSFRLPHGVSYETFHAALKGEGFTVYAGQGNLSGRIFRIAVMGALETSHIDRFLRACSRVFDAGEGAHRP